MGDTSSTANSTITNKIQLINKVKDPFFGKIDLYHFMEPPYEYLMDYKKNYINDKQRMNKDLSLLKQIKNIQHPNLAKIHHIELKQDAEMCIKHQIVHTYVNYYNFTLKQALEKKKKTKHSFAEGDLVYIAKSLVSFALGLQKYGISKGTYRSQEIFLSPEGHIKLYLLNVDPENRHSCYYTVLSEKQKLSQYLLAPEQLFSLKKLDLQTKFDQFKADLFAIGLVMVQLITLDHAKFYYNYEQMEFMSDKIQFVLDSFTMSQYSQGFVRIIKGMLDPDPMRRLGLEEAHESLTLLASQKERIVYCIRLQADPNPNAQKKAQPPTRKITLSGITGKLLPKPISMVSSTSTSRPMTPPRSSPYNSFSSH